MAVEDVREWTEQWNAGERITELSVSAVKLTAKAHECEGERSANTLSVSVEESAHD